MEDLVETHILQAVCDMCFGRVYYRVCSFRINSCEVLLNVVVVPCLMNGRISETRKKNVRSFVFFTWFPFFFCTRSPTEFCTRSFQISAVLRWHVSSRTCFLMFLQGTRFGRFYGLAASWADFQVYLSQRFIRKKEPIFPGYRTREGDLTRWDWRDSTNYVDFFILSEQCPRASEVVTLLWFGEYCNTPRIDSRSPGEIAHSRAYGYDFVRSVFSGDRESSSSREEA